jgi:hypothetical protein
LAGINIDKARNRHVVDAVVVLSSDAAALRVAEAGQRRAGRTKAYSSRNGGETQG